MTTTQLAFTLNRNGHPAGKLHQLGSDGKALCGKPTADPLPDLGPTRPTCTACRART